ncbi:elongator complex protein 3 [Candidatus Omnitrophota bacterium]
MKSHYTIPFFIPHEGCPFACIFCGQKKITGRGRGIKVPEISRTISRFLRTIPKEGTRREVAFFGGSFTGLPISRQKEYLNAVGPFIEKGDIHGIRLSTRPDYIDSRILDMLKGYRVFCIELGVQSMSGDVLKAAKRGHTVNDIERSSRLILKNGFQLAHQIMVGLPKSTLSEELKTARMSVAMGANEVRIYPVIVIKATELAALWKKRLYRPLTENEAVLRCARLIDLFKKNNVRILRCGLHPSPGLLSGEAILDGPFHQAFGQKVRSYLCGEMLKSFFTRERCPASIKHIFFNPFDAAYVIGYKRQNAAEAESILKRRDIFAASDTVKPGSVIVEYVDGITKTVGRV